MTENRIELSDLLKCRAKLFTTVIDCLPDNGKEFLLTMKSGSPKWELIDYVDAKNLPALQWKLKNIRNLGAEKRASQLAKLDLVLSR